MHVCARSGSLRGGSGRKVYVDKLSTGIRKFCGFLYASVLQSRRAWRESCYSIIV